MRNSAEGIRTAATCGAPLCSWQSRQWHCRANCGSPAHSYLTALHRHPPVLVGIWRSHDRSGPSMWAKLNVELPRSQLGAMMMAEVALSASIWQGAYSVACSPVEA